MQCGTGTVGLFSHVQFLSFKFFHILLIKLSSTGHPSYQMLRSDPDPNKINSDPKQ